MKPVMSATVEQLPNCMYKMKNIYSEWSDSAPATKDDLLISAESLLQRQNAVISKLEALQIKINSALEGHQSSGNSALNLSTTKEIVLPKEIVITCNPTVPARALLQMITNIKSEKNVLCVFYTHNSAKHAPCLDLSKYGFQTDIQAVTRCDKDMVVTWIWKECDECEMMISPIQQIKIVNEANICRYLLRVLGSYPNDAAAASIMDQWLDTATDLVKARNSEKTSTVEKISNYLSKSSFISGNNVGVEDLVLHSAFMRTVSAEQSIKDKVLRQWCSAVSSHLIL